MSADLDTLSAKADRARLAYEKAEAEQQRALEQEQARQAAEQRQRDITFLAGYDDDRLAEEVRAARRDVLTAAAADPVFSAMARVYALQLRRAHLAAEAQTVAARLGSDVRVTSRPASEPDVQFLVRLVADLGEDLHGAMTDSANQ